MESWVKIAKVRAFRPTEKNEALILEYMKKEKVGLTKAINDLIEKDHSKEVTETTGVYIYCPKRPLPIPLEAPLATWKTPVDSSVCRTCGGYPCEEWKQQESYERTNKNPVHVPRPHDRGRT